jgi:hypothetical protein
MCPNRNPNSHFIANSLIPTQKKYTDIWMIPILEMLTPKLHVYRKAHFQMSISKIRDLGPSNSQVQPHILGISPTHGPYHKTQGKPYHKPKHTLITRQ